MTSATATEKTEKVACCVPIAAQHATNADFSATYERNRNATNGLKALAGAVLLRNSLCNNSATDTLKHAQQMTQKNDDFVAQSCAHIEPKNDGKTGAITYPRLVTCWTPAGNPMPILATGPEHEAFLLTMNPRPKA